MKKILFSLGTVLAVGALVTGGTVAFFTDTETSAGNVFTAGSIDIKVDSFGAIYNGEDINNASWSARDLTDEHFFDLEDLKPADIYNRSISIHVADNPGWLCLGTADTTDDQENGIVEAEDDAGDVTDPEGELSDNVHVLVWKEIIPDLVHQSNEPILIDSFFDVFVDLPLRDSTTGNGPTDPIQTELLAMSLCGGSHVIAPGPGFGGAVTCNGGTMSNQAQTDSLTADLVIYGEQHRNNPDFECADLGDGPNPN